MVVIYFVNGGDHLKTVRKKESVTRSHNTSIPKPFSPIPTLYKNADKASLVWNVLGDDSLAEALGNGWEEVAPKMLGESDKYTIRYSIVGGPDNHCFEVWVEGAEAGNHDIEWIYVRSVTGGQLKIVRPEKDAHVLCAMAEEDAYMFCTNDPCILCAFGCKIGFEFYAYSRSEGLLKDAVKVVYSKQNPHNNPL